MRRLGRYLAYQEIASGGMASIHVGCLPGPFDFTRTVAIKELHKHLLGEPAALAMFVDEARLASRIVHPNVVPVLDVAREEEQIYLVMDYVDGESLAAALAASNRGGKRIPIAIVTAIMTDMLRGLHAAHELRDAEGALLGLVHRDVSPQNTLVGADGVTRLVDFGVAKARDRIFSTQGTDLKGKIRYMAPEQLSDGVVDRRSDLWAAAVVLWEALTGSRLFTGESAAVVMGKIASGPIARPSTVNPEVVQFDVLFSRFLARDPDARPQTATQLREELSAICSPAPADAVGVWLEGIVPECLAKKRQVVRDMDVARRAIVDGWIVPHDQAVSGQGATLDTALDTALGLARTADPAVPPPPLPTTSIGGTASASPSMAGLASRGPRVRNAWLVAVLALGALSALLLFILLFRSVGLASRGGPGKSAAGGPSELPSMVRPPTVPPDSTPMAPMTPAPSAPMPNAPPARPRILRRPEVVVAPQVPVPRVSAAMPSATGAPPRDCLPPYIVGPAPDFIRTLKRECVASP